MTDLQAVLFVVCCVAAQWALYAGWRARQRRLRKERNAEMDTVSRPVPRRQYPVPISRPTSKARGPARIEGRLVAARRAKEAAAVPQLSPQPQQPKNNSRLTYPAEVADADSGGNAA